MKFAVMGITGQTGKVVAEYLKKAGHQVRGIIRNQAHQPALEALGYETFMAQANNTDELTAAFSGVDGAYLMNPPAYFEEDMFVVAQQVYDAILDAMKASNLPHAVALSSVGGHLPSGTGNIGTCYYFEQKIKQSKLNISVLRAPNFLDNWKGALATAKEKGIFPSMFSPLDKKWPMASSLDIGQAGAQLLMESHKAPRLTELKGPEDYSTNDAVQIVSELLDKPIKAVEVPAADIAPFFASMGFPEVSAKAFQDMMAGFNNESIIFTGEGDVRTGTTSLREAMELLL